ncbi:MAG: hypothetical protein RJA00_964 [Bacteroidota bacterium]|jgi:hypothetical protein
MLMLSITLTSYHPYHVGVTEIFIHPNKEVGVSCKLFVDDVQDAIYRESGQKVNLALKRPEDTKALNAYLQPKLQVKWGSKPLPLLMIGYEFEEEAVWCYFESQIKGKSRQITLCNRALYEQMSTQSHFLMLQYNDQKLRWKLTNPEGCHTFTFK